MNRLSPHDRRQRTGAAPATPAGGHCRTSFRDRLAFLISALASPFLILPAFTLALTARLSGGRWGLLLLWTAVAAFFTTVIPFLYIAIGVRAGWITDLHVMRRDQRSRPFVAALVSSAVGTAVLHWIGAPLPLVVLGVGIVANGIVFALITLRWKISMHPSVFTACVLCCTFMINTGWAWLLFFVPAIIWARIQRTRHSAAQGIAAVLVSALVTIGVLGSFGYLGG